MTRTYNNPRGFSWMEWYEAQTDNAVFDAMKLKARAAALHKDTDTITEYGLTQRLSFQIRVF